MKHKLWTLTFVLALLKTGLDLFYGRMDRDGTLETQGQPSTRLTLATPRPPVRGSVKCFLCNPVGEPDFHEQQWDTGIYDQMQ